MIGSNVKTDAWSNAYNQHLYSELTGQIRELTSLDQSDESDTRFQPPLVEQSHVNHPYGQKILPVVEGYRLANNDFLPSSRSSSKTNDPAHERNKRDSASDNSSVQISNVHTGQVSIRLSNNVTEDESMISDTDADAWARSLSLSAGVDGSGTDSKFQVLRRRRRERKVSNDIHRELSIDNIESSSESLTSLPAGMKENEVCSLRDDLYG